MQSIFNPAILQMVQNHFSKAAFVDAAMAGGIMPPPQAGMPPGMPPQGGMPPGGMDPSMGGGMPPGATPGSALGGDPAMQAQGMDPSMMGMPPSGGMDPAMMQQAPPPMDPSMGGGMPPGGDPAAAGAQAGGSPPPSPGGDQPLTADTVRQIVQEMMTQNGAGGQAKPKKVDPTAEIPAMRQDLHQTKMMLANLFSAMNLPMDPKALLQPPEASQGEQQGAANSGGGGQSQGGEKSATIGYAGRGIHSANNMQLMSLSLSQTLTPNAFAEKAAAIHSVLKARRMS